MHYTVKIKSFSLLAKNSMERYETGEFESGGYKWKLVIYPNRNKNNNVDEHMSLYLAIEAADLRPPDTKKKERLFRGIKLEWGYDKVIPLKNFNDASNGYLVDDTCVFGAEVFVSKQRSMDKEECLALIKDSITKKSVIRFENYSKLTVESHYSAPFNVGNHKWKIRICPIGEGIGMDISRSISDAPPTHYTVKIQSLSLLAKNSIERYETGAFESGGYKWKLVIYPNGNKIKNANEHVSLYLAIEAADSLPPGWEVHAVFRFFLLDQTRDNYLIIQDTTKKEKRFRGMKLEWGLDKAISIKAFNDVSNGFLVDDTCVFGAEVFVCKERSTGKGECVSLIKDAIANKKIRLYPSGKGIGMGSHVSLYLALADPTSLPPGLKIFAEFTLRMLDQIHSRHHYGKVSRWFSASSQEQGWSRFISIGYMNLTNMGYLMKDACLVEAEVTVHAVVNALS
ncbi:ubiquitin carboxyl-terminal hydrolase 12 [Quercus suber]|uniref:Ubiquitin carboxyl-terminal hydrolase 12 n=1 Tax=Quercus suber TaxID=58331 RepID=A0AAW0KBG3_QUESU